MNPVIRDVARRSGVPIATAVLTLLVQAVLYLVTVREDIRTVKRDVSDMRKEVQETRCDMAIALRRVSMPEGCVVNPLGRQP